MVHNGIGVFRAAREMADCAEEVRISHRDETGQFGQPISRKTWGSLGRIKK